jgi:hypothetical protein
MHSWESMQPLKSSLRPRHGYWHEVTAAGALLTCFAVVLNLGPLAKLREAPRAATEPPAASDSSIRPQVVSGVQPDRARSTVEAVDGAETINPSTDLSAILDDAFGRFGVQPARPSDRDTEIPVRQVRQEHEQVVQLLAPIVGIWAPDANACTARYFREGFLPTIINADGAWAGETFCVFRNQKQTETGWKVVASCSNPTEHWTTEVRLTVKDNRLMWTSKRGTQAYTRCAPDFLMALAR